MTSKRYFLIIAAMFISLSGVAASQLPDSLLTFDKAYYYNIVDMPKSLQIVQTIRDRKMAAEWECDRAEANLWSLDRHYNRAIKLYRKVLDNPEASESWEEELSTLFLASYCYEKLNDERHLSKLVLRMRELAEKHHFSFDDLVKWYDGYQIGAEPSVFNPNSVMQALYSDWCESYWASTGAYDAVAGYINMNYDGLKDDIIKMLAGGRAKVDPTGFQNDLSLIRNRDDVLTVLIHLGYLSYDRTRQECYIPNREVAGEMVNAVKSNQWEPVIKALEQSERLLQATLDGDEEAVARGVDVAHDEHTSILSYNDENSLACVLSIAYYYAKNDYIMHRELASGKGFADIVLIPRKNVDSPAIVLELKYNKDADTAISQIRRKQYPAKVSDYTNNLLLVGINYDKQQKKHECHIERYKH